MERLYTVGHSDLTVEAFLALIKGQGINCIVDVRSVPYSKYTPQFNEPSIKNFLKSEGIIYMHFGKEFGARRTDCLCEIDVECGKQQVNFEEGTKTEAFLQGVERIKKGISQGWRISLMCSESNPLECHRFSFVSRFFYDHGWKVLHILKDSSVVDHKNLEDEMINDYFKRKKVKEVIASLFGEEYSYTKEMQRNDSYKIKNREIGWIYSPNDSNSNNY